MNELEKALLKILEKSMELAEKTGEFIITEGSELLQQFYLWHTTKAILGIILAFIVLILGFITPRMFGKKESFKYAFNDQSRKVLGIYLTQDGCAAYVAVLIISFFTFSILFIINIYKLVFILVAPKLYLIDYFL